MKYVRLAAAAAHPLVGRFGKPVSLLDYLHLLAVVAGQIGLEHLLIGIFYHSVFLFGSIMRIFGHNAELRELKKEKI